MKRTKIVVIFYHQARIYWVDQSASVGGFMVGIKLYHELGWMGNAHINAMENLVLVKSNLLLQEEKKTSVLASDANTPLREQSWKTWMTDDFAKSEAWAILRGYKVFADRLRAACVVGATALGQSLPPARDERLTQRSEHGIIEKKTARIHA